MVASKLIQRLMHFYWRFSRPMTLGVRALVVDGEQRILLVRHTYVAGWYLPGGGVETGETLEQALAKELREEANLFFEKTPALIGIYRNIKASRRDHVVLYHVKEWRQPEMPKPNSEIAECAWFALDDLPEGITAGTLRRIGEVLNGKLLDAYW
ncbi:MAG: NUDIX hydrolase [Hyphomicrobiales bacterium]|nr:MAG: NUDIX hydrolase [Hyphomicrobiales bacterium]